MVALLEQVSSFLTTPEGSLIYRLIVLFSIASALQAAYVHWRSSEFPQASRTLFGLIILMAAQVSGFTVIILGQLGVLAPQVILPPLDRAITAFSLVWMIWLWAFPEPSRSADAATWLLSVLVAAGFGLTTVAYSASAGAVQPPFNGSTYDTAWQMATMGLAVFGLIVLLVRRPDGWGNGVAVMALFFTGSLLYMLSGSQDGSIAGPVRLMELAAFPMLMTLPQRFPLATSRVTSVKQQDVPVAGERRRYSTDPKTFHALLALAGESQTDKLSQAITRAIAQTMLADLCFLIYLTDNNNQLQIASGYDLIREENLEGGSLSKSIIPMLTNALQRGRPLRLPASSTSADIKGLSDMLGLNSPGHIMSVPIVTPEKAPLGGVLLLSPYSSRQWSAEDQAFLNNIAVSLVPIIQRGQRMTTLEQRGEQTRQALDVAQEQMKELQRRNDDLLKQMEKVRANSQSGLDQAENLVALTAIYETTQKAFDKAQAGERRAEGRPGRRCRRPGAQCQRDTNRERAASYIGRGGPPAEPAGGSQYARDRDGKGRRLGPVHRAGGGGRLHLPGAAPAHVVHCGLY